jgi:hypothetical protein
MLDKTKPSYKAGKAMDLINLFLFSHPEEFTIMAPLFLKDGVFQALKHRSPIALESLADLNFATEHVLLLSKYLTMKTQDT